MSVHTLALLTPSHFKGENHGLYVQHVGSMCELLAESDCGWSVRAVHPGGPDFERIALDSDVAIAHMSPSPLVEAAIRVRRERGLATVFELGDNFLALGRWLPPRHPLRNPLYRQQILYNASLCDAVQVYGARLASLFRSVNPRIEVLDPYVPIAAEAAPRDPGKLVVGWGGTTSHEDDLAPIAPTIVEFCARHSDAMFAYMGNDELFRRHFGAVPAAQVIARPFGEHDDYLSFVDRWDIGLAPLRRCGFNEGRSDAKFATYAARGVAGVLADHPVYQPHATRAALFGSPSELRERLEALYFDRAALADIARRGHDWAKTERSASRLRAQRVDLYESLLPQRPVPPLADPVDLAAAARSSPLARVREAHRGSGDAGAYLRAALRAQPYDYLALSAAVRALEDQGRDGVELATLYERLCMIAPELVPECRRPAHIAAFLIP